MVLSRVPFLRAAFESRHVQSLRQGCKVDSWREDVSAPSDRFGNGAVSYLASAASSLNILHLGWCRHTCAIGPDRCIFYFLVDETQSRNSNADPVQQCARCTCWLMYAKGTHHCCTSMTRAHILEQCDSAFDFRDHVLPSFERRLQIR